MSQRRPMYESRFDRENEEKIARCVAQSLLQSYRRMGAAYPIDYVIMYDGGKGMPLVTGLLECKVRHYKFEELEKMGGVLLSLHKWLFAKRVASELRVPFYFAVQDADEVMRVAAWGTWVGTDMTPWPQYKARYGGRLDRSDPVDLEPVIMIPVEDFGVPL